MAGRQRHQNGELEDVLLEAEQKGWRVTRGKRYFMMWCPCVVKHKKTVRLTPSGRNYKRNLLGELKRSTCWEVANDGSQPGD